MQGEVEITAPYPLLSKAGIKKDFSLTLISDSSIKILGGHREERGTITEAICDIWTARFKT
jgi:hypothetical protein